MQVAILWLQHHLRLPLPLLSISHLHSCLFLTISVRTHLQVDDMRVETMRQVPLECDINIAVNGPFWVEVANPEHPFTAMMISCSRGTYLICKMIQSQLPNVELPLSYILIKIATNMNPSFRPLAHSHPSFFPLSHFLLRLSILILEFPIEGGGRRPGADGLQIGDRIFLWLGRKILGFHYLFLQFAMSQLQYRESL